MHCNDAPAMNHLLIIHVYIAPLHAMTACLICVIYVCAYLTLLCHYMVGSFAITAAKLYAQMIHQNSTYAIARRLELWLTLLYNYGQAYSAINNSFVRTHACNL